MDVIGTALCNQLELAARALICGSTETGHATVKLFDGIDRSIADDDKIGADAGVVLHRAAVGQIVYVEAVDGDVILVRARSGNGRLIGDTRLQKKQRQRIVSLLDGKLVQLLDIDRIADGGVRSIDGDLGVGGIHFDCDVGSDAERSVLRAHLGDRQVDVLYIERGKAVSREDNLITGARGYLGEAVGA